MTCLFSLYPKQNWIVDAIRKYSKKKYLLEMCNMKKMHKNEIGQYEQFAI